MEEEVIITWFFITIENEEHVGFGLTISYNSICY